MPKVSVVMAVKNGKPFIEEAIESILNQTFRDFEFIIIDDYSTDGTLEYLESIHDTRIKILTNKENIGLTRSLNKSIRLANGEYIARLDADDLAYPERLKKQIEYLEKHPDVGLLASYCNVINESGDILNNGGHLCTSPEKISAMFLVDNYLASCSVMFRKKIFDTVGGYPEKYRYAQDYALWTQFALYSKVAKLNEWLVAWRERPDGLTEMKRDKQAYCAAQISVEYMRAKMPWLSQYPDKKLYRFRKEHKGKFRNYILNESSDYEKYFKEKIL